MLNLGGTPPTSSARALLWTLDLAESAKFAAAGARAGVAVATVMSRAALRDAPFDSVRLVVVDLHAAGAEIGAVVEELRRQRAEGLTIVAYGPHVQTAWLEAAANAGCDQVMTRGQFHTQLDETLRRVAASA